jgi:NADH-quinone oxidoreductase subunit G
VNGELTPASWDEALDLVAGRLKGAGSDLLTLASGRLSNEDLFNLRSVTAHLNGKTALYSEMAGGDLVAQVGVGRGTNFSDLGPETAIFVVASNLIEEAPIYWLRVKQAVERGAKLIVANPRYTKIERYAGRVLRYPYGAEAALLSAMINSLSTKGIDLPPEFRDLDRSKAIQEAAKEFSDAENAIILFGSEGTGFQSSRHLSQACANLLIVTDHIGKTNNGLIGVWPRANTQGAWDMGFQPVDDLEQLVRSQKSLYIVAADPAGDDPALVDAINSADFLVVQELFLTETAKLADVVLPAQSFIEREGTLTNGERRVQRFFTAVQERPQTLPDFSIIAQIGQRAGIELEHRFPVHVMDQIAEQVPDYSEVSYAKVSAVIGQWPTIGRADVYYGGTSYENSQGLGFELHSAAQRGEQVSLAAVQLSESNTSDGVDLIAVPITILYDRGQTVVPAALLHQRIPEPYVLVHPQTTAPLGITEGAQMRLNLSGVEHVVVAHMDETIPQEVVLIPRSMGIPIHGLTPVEIAIVEQAVK